DVPMQRAAGLGGGVGKAMELFEGEAAVFERAEHEASAFGAEIASQVMRHFGGVDYRGRFVKEMATRFHSFKDIVTRRSQSAASCAVGTDRLITLHPCPPPAKIRNPRNNQKN